MDGYLLHTTFSDFPIFFELPTASDEVDVYHAALFLIEDAGYVALIEPAEAIRNIYGPYDVGCAEALAEYPIVA